MPAFSRIRAADVEPAVDWLLADARRQIEALATGGGRFDWANLAEPLEQIEERLNRAWAPIGHLHSVADSPALRDAYNACLPKLADYAAEIGQKERLYHAYRSIRTTSGQSTSGDHQLSSAQRRVIENALRDFRLAGVDLDPGNKARYRDIVSRLAELGSRFEENVLDATQGWKKQITLAADLAGLPESARGLLASAARRENIDGWLVGLDFPSYYPFVTFSDDPSLRAEIYEAYTTRASDEGPHAGTWDNSATMEEILALRHEQARTLGYPNFAELSLAKKMAPSTDRVMSFLTELATRSKPAAERELAELTEFARSCDGATDVEAWNISYYSEKLRAQRFAFSQEDLRPYFPAPKVLEGLFEIVRRLYGISIGPGGPGRPSAPVDVWHPDVEFYEIRDAAGGRRGDFYLDLYARPHKRGGAWMDECAVRARVGDRIQLPAAFITCNFAPPVDDAPALLTHDEVTTLFHEFGHGLHHLLTAIDHPSISGINGVAWDAIELPSQIMENWCWQPEALSLCSGHHETGEPLPRHLVDRLNAAKTFQSGMRMVRQLEFAILDFRLHLEYEPGKGGRLRELMDDVRGQVAVITPPPFNRFAHAFTHVFGGGYAAGYYSYKWAEALSCDAFDRFEADGIFNPDTGQDFLRSILEPGGSRDPMELFVAFRGREPSIDALLRHSGLIHT